MTDPAGRNAHSSMGQAGRLLVAVLAVHALLLAALLAFALR
jgi:hypothetical protein